MLDDHAAKTAVAKETEFRKREEETSLVARRLAMVSLKESGYDSAPVKKRKETELKGFLITLKEKELKDLTLKETTLKDLLITLKEKKMTERHEVWELVAERRRREREEDRDEAARAHREANELMLRLVSVIGDAVLAVVKANRGD